MKKIYYLLLSLFLILNITACSGYKPIFSSPEFKFKIADHSIIIKSKSTPRIQEVHRVVTHLICDLTEKKFRYTK